ncbi:MAG: iron-containing redox enzyme family protein [Deltaproteobacteria bacterium]|nr:iron-containing redox enzyme family protein [Deltaproteobacteria bacterium]
MENLADRLLAIMDRKDHWAWPAFLRPGLARAELATHFRHEYHTYVRDFPIMLARVLGLGPPDDVRRTLAANVYEEQTGGLSFGVSHPDLFLEMMEGLGLDRVALSSPEGLVPEAVAYRAMLDRVSSRPPWIVGAAVLGIFVEGSVNERATLAGSRSEPPLEEAIALHPLVRHHGCPPAAMRLVRAHRMVEGGHRQDAWNAVLGHAPAARGAHDAIVAAMDEALALWLSYRDGVARAMGLVRQ